jgi:hypothetical protein
MTDDEKTIDEVFEQLLNEAREAQIGMRKRGPQMRDIHGTIMELLIPFIDITAESIIDLDSRVMELERDAVASALESMAPGLRQFCEQVRALAISTENPPPGVDLRMLVEAAEGMLAQMTTAQEEEPDEKDAEDRGGELGDAEAAEPAEDSPDVKPE